VIGSDAVSIHQAVTTALDALIEQINGDRSILVAIPCGSLSHDTVWAKSDIGLVLVTIDDKKNRGGRRPSIARSWPMGGCCTRTPALPRGAHAGLRPRGLAWRSRRCHTGSGQRPDQE